MAFYNDLFAANGPNRRQLSIWISPGPDAPKPPEKVPAQEAAAVGDEATQTGVEGAMNEVLEEEEDLVLPEVTALTQSELFGFQCGLGMFPLPEPKLHPLHSAAV